MGKGKREDKIKILHLILLALALPSLFPLFLKIFSLFNFFPIDEKFIWLLAFFSLFFLSYLTFQVSRDTFYLKPLIYLTGFGAPLLFGLFYAFAQKLGLSQNFSWSYSLINILAISILLGSLVTLIWYQKNKKVAFSLFLPPGLTAISLGAFLVFSKILSFLTPFLSTSCPLSS